MATPWTLVPCLVTLRDEFNRLAPNRDKASDGSVGDTSHAANSSDHNPDETGNTPTEDADRKNEVHAVDVDETLRQAGWTMERCVEIIVGRHRRGEDDRLQNVIYNRRIWSRSWGWTAQPYTGTSPHTEHAHFSARYTTAQESDTSPWGLLEEDDVTKAELHAWMTEWAKSATGRVALATAVLNTDQVVPAPGNPKPGTNPDGTPINTHWAASSFLKGTYDAAVSARTFSAAAAKDDADEAAIVAGVLEGLGGSTESDAELAAVLRAALGDRATAVGQLLATVEG